MVIAAQLLLGFASSKYQSCLLLLQLCPCLQFVIFLVCAMFLEVRGTFNLIADYKENYFLEDKLWCKLQQCVPV